jgi:hypothetical protein
VSPEGRGVPSPSEMMGLGSSKLMVIALAAMKRFENLALEFYLEVWGGLIWFPYRIARAVVGREFVAEDCTNTFPGRYYYDREQDNL